jgi:formylglycine-generating enzyme required for sulfatase activity
LPIVDRQDTLPFRHVAEAIVSDLQGLVYEDTAQRQEAADALADIAAWRAKPFLIDAVANDTAPPAVALAALLALTQAADKAVEDTLFADVGRILCLLHGQLPLVMSSLRARILVLLDRLGHPLVYVPVGEFLMGSNGGFANERPQHAVTLHEDWIDQFPVTNAQFDQFVRETGYQAQGDWRSEFRPGKEQYPVVYVTWEDACAYGKWCGKRLPTEAEWEKAARGIDGREYPWGNRWDGNNCNVSGRGTTPVGSYPAGLSPYGCYDMAGNVWEWVADWYGPDYYKASPGENPSGPAAGDRRVVRGGSWYDGLDYARAASRPGAFLVAAAASLASGWCVRPPFYPESLITDCRVAAIMFLSALCAFRAIFWRLPRFMPQ